MVIDLKDVALFMLLAVLALLRWQSVAVREHALQKVKKHLKALDLQLLDQTVAWQAIRLQRDKQQRLRPMRTFAFEFSSTGAERYNGHVRLLGSQIVDIHLEPYRIQADDEVTLH
jgi:hypothetical protein